MKSYANKATPLGKSIDTSIGFEVAMLNSNHGDLLETLFTIYHNA